MSTIHIMRPAVANVDTPTRKPPESSTVIRRISVPETRQEIVYRFLAGGSTRYLANKVGHCERESVEDVIREEFRRDRARRWDLEARLVQATMDERRAA